VDVGEKRARLDKFNGIFIVAWLIIQFSRIQQVYSENP
jgi:hypothetical protein